MATRLAKELDNGEGLEKTYATVKDHDGRNALHFAANGGQNDVCGYLVNEMKLDLHSKDEIDGYTALHHAVRAGRISTAEYLIQIGANVSSSGLHGWTPFFEATDKGNVKMMKLLISSGADIESISDDCETPLHMVAASGRADLVEFLLKHNANPNSIGARERTTPLILSILAKSLECVKLLLKAGADPNLVVDGKVPIYLAKQLKQSGMVKCMMKHGAVFDTRDIAAELGFDTSSCGSSAQNEEEEKYTITVACFAEKEESSAKCKEEGRDAFKKREYHQAATWYTKAINLDPTDETLFSNRSLCWLRLSQGDKALDDALACVELKPNWFKAHYMEGAAYKFLENYEKAAEAFAKACQLDPDNKEILKQLHDVQDMVLGVI